MIPETFISHAANILADTHAGLSGGKIVEYLSAYSIEYNVDIPYNEYPFDAPNKRTALRENIKSFIPEVQYRILKELCGLEIFSGNSDVKDLKIKLFSRYGHLGQGGDNSQVNEILIDETIHWLQSYPDALKIYKEAIEKFDNQLFQRNLLDDLRLSLEVFLKNILGNSVGFPFLERCSFRFDYKLLAINSSFFIASSVSSMRF